MVNTGYANSVQTAAVSIILIWYAKGMQCMHEQYAQVGNCLEIEFIS